MNPFFDKLPDNLKELPLITAAQRDLLNDPTAQVQVIVFDANNPLSVPARMAMAEFIKFPAGLTVNSSSVTALGIATSTSANALAIGPAGATNPSINVDASTASAATGLNIKSAAAGGGLAVSVISSGTNESLTIDAKGSGTITLNGTGTGNIVLGRATTTAFAIIQTSAAAAAFSSGLNGDTNPVFRLVNNVASQATGISITGRAAAAGVDITVLSSGTDENLVINAKGAGTITLNPTATGKVVIGKAQITRQVQTITGDGAITIQSGIVLLTKGSIAAITLAAPSSQDGTEITITSTTDFAHVVTVTGGMWDGTADTNTTVTFPVVAGAAVTLVAFGTDWYVVSNQGTTIAP